MKRRSEKDIQASWTGRNRDANKRNPHINSCKLLIRFDLRRSDGGIVEEFAWFRERLPFDLGRFLPNMRTFVPPRLEQ
jgi:hypothetical protein